MQKNRKGFVSTPLKQNERHMNEYIFIYNTTRKIGAGYQRKMLL